MRSADHASVPCDKLLRAVVVMLFVAMFSPLLAQNKDSAAESANHIRICALDLKSQQSRTLFTLDKMQFVESIAVSPDGRRLAFDGITKGEKHSSGSFRIRICRLDGSESINVAHGMRPTWSPRGKRLAFTKTPNQGVWVMQNDGSNDQLIDKFGQGAAWSPDGQKIAYVLKTVDDSYDIVVFNIVEDEYLSILGTAAAQFEFISGRFAWTPDSRRLYFMGRHKNEDMRVFRVAADGGASPEKHNAELPRTLASVTWFKKDTVQIVMRSEETQLQQLYSLAFGAPTKLAVPADIDGQVQDRFNTASDLTNGGQLLIYVSNLTGQH